MTNENALALEIAALQSDIKRIEANLATKKAELISQVGTGGAKFETALGVVSVTQQTSDRPTGTFSFSLNSSEFNLLDERIQANLIKQGVVEKTEKVTRGTAPVVKVSLR